jgi:hypothetical protein
MTPNSVAASKYTEFSIEQVDLEDNQWNEMWQEPRAKRRSENRHDSRGKKKKAVLNDASNGQDSQPTYKQLDLLNKLYKRELDEEKACVAFLNTELAMQEAQNQERANKNSRLMIELDAEKARVDSLTAKLEKIKKEKNKIRIELGAEIARVEDELNHNLQGHAAEIDRAKDEGDKICQALRAEINLLEMKRKSDHDEHCAKVARLNATISSLTKEHNQTSQEQTAELTRMKMELSKKNQEMDSMYKQSGENSRLMQKLTEDHARLVTIIQGQERNAVNKNRQMEHVPIVEVGVVTQTDMDLNDDHEALVRKIESACQDFKQKEVLMEKTKVDAEKSRAKAEKARADAEKAHAKAKKAHDDAMKAQTHAKNLVDAAAMYARNEQDKLDQLKTVVLQAKEGYFPLADDAENAVPV